VACRTAQATQAIGVLCLAFPLLPPQRQGSTKKPESRQPELNAVEVPMLIVQGRNDSFGMPRSDTGRARTVVRVNGDHGLKGDAQAVAGAIRSWLGDLVAR
jgi:predicted alpha/beta-hydrolase family hydrolase